MDQVLKAIKDALFDTLKSALVKTVIKKINPSVGAITTMIDIGRWFMNNVSLIVEFVNEMGKAVPHLLTNVPAAAEAVEQGLKKATPMLISLTASLANLNDLPNKAREALRNIGASIRGTLVSGLSKVLIVAEKVVRSRWPKSSGTSSTPSGFGHQASEIQRWNVNTGGQRSELHTLHIAVPPSGGGQGQGSTTAGVTSGTVVYRGPTEKTLDVQLQEWKAQNPDKTRLDKIKAAEAHYEKTLKPLVAAISKAMTKFKAKLAAIAAAQATKDPQKISTAEAEGGVAFGEVAQSTNAAEAAMLQQTALTKACEGDNAGCFAAGTRLWTPDGYRAVESIREGDLVFSQDQYRPDGPIEAKPVEKVFRRLAEVQHLHLRGPNGFVVTIRTTGEHPFFAHGRGWTAKKDLTVEDWVLTDTGDWAKVEEVYSTGELEIV